MRLNILTPDEEKQFRATLALFSDDPANYNGRFNDPSFELDWFISDWPSPIGEGIPEDYSGPARNEPALNLCGRGVLGDYSFFAADLGNCHFDGTALYLPMGGGSELIVDLYPVDDDRPTSNFPAEVARRRAEQDAKHGGPAHDDTHVPLDWLNVLCRYFGNFEHAARFGADSPYDYRDLLVDLAALAQAAAESYDRIEAHNEVQVTDPKLKPHALNQSTQRRGRVRSEISDADQSSPRSPRTSEADLSLEPYPDRR